LRQASMNIVPSLIGIGAIFGIQLLVSLFAAYFFPTQITSLISLYLFIFVISGIVYTSGIFQELNSAERGYAFLTLPVSTLEKMLGSWLLSSPLFILVYFLLISLIYGLSTLVAHDMSSFTALFSQRTGNAIGGYLIAQTIFFLGACTFKKNSLLKTLLSLFLIGVGLSICMAICAWFLFRGGIGTGGTFTWGVADFSGAGFNKTVHNIFLALLAPFLLLVSYFKLKEREV